MTTEKKPTPKNFKKQRRFFDLLLKQMIFVCLFFKIEDNGATSLTHHLPRGFEGNCVLASAYGAGCTLVVDKTISRTTKT
jgi:hypothetical protein